MTKLKRAGFFRELRHGYADGPSLHDAIDRGLAGDDAEGLAFYLKSAPALYTTPGYVEDVLSPGTIIGAPHIRTDGVWAWPSDLEHYLTVYKCALPDEFVARIRAHKYQPPTEETIDFPSLEF